MSKYHNINLTSLLIVCTFGVNYCTSLQTHKAEEGPAERYDSGGRSSPTQSSSSQRRSTVSLTSKHSPSYVDTVYIRYIRSYCLSYDCCGAYPQQVMLSTAPSSRITFHLHVSHGLDASRWVGRAASGAATTVSVHPRSTHRLANHDYQHDKHGQKNENAANSDCNHGGQGYNVSVTLGVGKCIDSDCRRWPMNVD